MASKLLIFTIFVFDVIAFSLAVAAEQRRSKAHIENDTNKTYSYCAYDSDIATGFGVVAFLLLMLSHILVMVASRCFCCGKALRPGGSRSCAVLLFILCWVSFLIAESCLLAGSVQNAYHTRYTTVYVLDPPMCQTLRKGVFASGAAFSFLTAILSTFYYISFSKANNRDRGYGTESNSMVGMSSYS